MREESTENKEHTRDEIQQYNNVTRRDESRENKEQTIEQIQ